MKKILTFIAILSVITTQGANAQTFVSQRSANGDSAIGNGTGLLHIDNMLKATANQVTLKWNVVGYSTNIGVSGTPWTLDGICDNVLCYLGAPLLSGTVYTTAPYNSSAFSTFYALLNSDSAASGTSAWVRVRVRDTAMGSTDRTLTFIGTKNPAGVAQTVLGEGVQLYPNPANTSLFVSIPDNMDVKALSITGADGKRIKTQNASRGMSELDLNALPAGTYFLQLLGQNGIVIGSRRFIHN